MLLFPIAYTIFIVLANLLLGFVSYKKNPRSISNRFLSITTIINSAWAIANYFSLNSPDNASTLYWIRLVMFFTSFLPPTIYFFVTSFPENVIKNNKVTTYILPLVILINAGLTFTPLIFSGLLTKPQIQPIPGPGIAIWGFVSIVFLVAALKDLFVKYRHASGLLKLQLKYIIVGFTVTFLLQMVSNYVLVVIFVFPYFVLLGPAFSFILLGFIGYAIIRHRLFDIRTIIARTISYSVLLLALVLFYISFILVASNFFLPYPFTVSQILIIFALTTFVTLTFGPIRSLFEEATNTVFFKGNYFEDKLIGDVNGILVSKIGLNDMISGVLKEITTQIRITAGTIVILKNQKIYNVGSVGSKKNLKLTPGDISALTPNIKPVVLADISDGKLKDLLRLNDFEYVSTLRVEEEVIGLFFLGSKASGDIYYNKDLSVLEMLIPGISVAAKNALSYEEIRQFGLTLELKVKQATKKIAMTNQRLKELSLLKDEFVSIASHELRTPMTAIKSYLWLALNKGYQLDEKLKNDLQRAYDSTERSISLVKDMLTISRIEGRRLKLISEKVELYQLINQVADELSIKAKEKSQQFGVEKPEKEIWVIADKDRLIEVLQNLIGNAFKFTPNNGKITVSVKTSGSMAEVLITDNGQGIPKDKIPQLFQKFGRLDHTYSKAAETPGTGLGLYIAKQIVSLHKGEIWVESEVGIGSTFIFSLPLVKEKPNDQPRQ